MWRQRRKSSPLRRTIGEADRKSDQQWEQKRCKVIHYTYL